MRPGEPSRTAFSAARHRAVHQHAEGAAIFCDPLAVRILGEDLCIADDADIAAARPMRLFIALRSRIADDAVSAALARGVRQIVVLGAGLDTTAYRRDWPDGAAVFEVDHPATQQWKCRVLEQRGIARPPVLRFVAMDFASDSLAERLAAAGFRIDRPSVFIWLGVVPYLTRDEIAAILHFAGGLEGNSEIVFDYGTPLQTLAPAQRKAREIRERMVAELGEPWISHFEPPALHAMLRAAGFCHIEDLEASEAVPRYLPVNTSRRDGEASGGGSGEGGGGHVVHAATFGCPA